MGSKERFGPRSFSPEPSLFVPACPKREPSWRSHGGQAIGMWGGTSLPGGKKEWEKASFLGLCLTWV